MDRYRPVSWAASAEVEVQALVQVEVLVALMLAVWSFLQEPELSLPALDLVVVLLLWLVP